MELLRSWLNDEMQLSRPVSSFETDLANGYLIGEILARHGLLRSMDALQDKETPGAKVNNLTAVQQALLDIGRHGVVVGLGCGLALRLRLEPGGCAR